MFNHNSAEGFPTKYGQTWKVWQTFLILGQPDLIAWIKTFRIFDKKTDWHTKGRSEE
jgi:hypothetical protein